MLNKPWVYLLRHGDIGPQARKRFIGQTDLPLSPRGEDQALWWRKQWARQSFARVYCSDLSRSRRTAELIVGDHCDRMEIQPLLREIALGEWDGLSVDEVDRRFPGEWSRRGSNIDHLVGRVSPTFTCGLPLCSMKLWRNLKGLFS
jgi:broad specificity phosphatase PhoE